MEINVFNNGRDVASAELIHEKYGPVIWLQTGVDGAYIPVDQLDEFIAGLKNVAASNTTASA
ncbi:hypothetical protein [Streptomyces sp. NPDC058291]|uniref:hypothetical protein n=1 Tax=Streptomyces sp. NPDC058291 TaxID=3346427 RepID=UPI0036F15618